MCDGDGHCVADASVATDCPAPATSCVIGACTANACTTANVAAGTACADSGSTPGCTGNTFTPAGTCDGSGTCAAVPETCSGATPMCDPVNGCVAESAGGACTANDQCASDVCDDAGSGHCCSAACVGGACGATSCDATGACVFPGNTVAPPSLQTAGSCQRVVCDGQGGTASVDDAGNAPPPSNNPCVTTGCSGAPLAPTSTNAVSGTMCVAGSCSAASATPARTCDGSGTCSPASPRR